VWLAYDFARTQAAQPAKGDLREARTRVMDENSKFGMSEGSAEMMKDSLSS